VQLTGRAPGAEPPPDPAADASLVELTERWRIGDVSNFDYLMRLNALAGRAARDRAHAPLLPWVLDFSVPPEPDMDSLQVPVLKIWDSSSWNNDTISRASVGLAL